MSGRLLLWALLLLFFLSGILFLALYLPRALAPLSLLERAIALGFGAGAIVSHLPAEIKARRLLLLLLPYVGIPLCLTLRASEELVGGCAPSSFEDPLLNGAANIARRGCGLSSCRCASAEYFRTGREMFARLLFDLEHAEKEILFDYYILSHGKFLDSVLTILEHKAKSGVQVKLIYDGFGCKDLPRRFSREMRARGIQARAFRPIKWFPFPRLNRRDHRKLTVIDRKIAYTGGVNFADEYIGEKIVYGHWKDTAIRLTGEPAKRFAALFFGERQEDSPMGTGSACVVFGDKAERKARVGEEIYFHCIVSARDRLFLCTPYFAPSERILSALKSAARAGVDVRLLIPHIPDKKSIFAVTRSFSRDLEKSGVSVREYAAGFLHAKSLCADGSYALVGSYNLDERSLRLQAECGVLLQDAPLSKSVELDFLTCWETGYALPKPTFRETALAALLKLILPFI